MKKLHVVIIMMAVSVCCRAQSDLIIMRSGTEYQGQVALVKQDKTVFKVDDNQMELSNSDIYMIKYKKLYKLVLK